MIEELTTKPKLKSTASKRTSSITTPPPLFPFTYVLGQKPNLNSKKQGYADVNKAEGMKSLDEISRIADSWEREREYLFYYFTKYYQQHKKTPSQSMCYQNYLTDTGYTKTDADREGRFKIQYDNMLGYFDPDKVRSSRKYGIYIKGDYMEDLKRLFSKADLRQMQNEINSKYTGVIKHEDIALAAGFYFVSLTRLLKQKDFSKSEFTVAQNNMIGWFNNLNSRFETSRTCDGKKVRVLRQILIDVGWLRCVDEDHVIGRSSRRHVLTKQFPRYEEFEKLVGKDNIDKWVAFSESQKSKKDKLVA